MIGKIQQIGTSLGVIIPKYIVKEMSLEKGSVIDIKLTDNQVIISKPKSKREGWAEAFKKYSQEIEQ